MRFYGLFAASNCDANILLVKFKQDNLTCKFLFNFTDLSNLTDFGHNPHLENVKVKFSDNNMREVNFVRRYFG